MFSDELCKYTCDVPNSVEVLDVQFLLITLMVRMTFGHASATVVLHDVIIELL